MKRIFTLLLALCLCCGSLAGCSCEHQWIEATCNTPWTCKLCHATSGAPKGHTWLAATCKTPKTCEVCGTTEGGLGGHDWLDATCEIPKICKNCSETEGEALGHRVGASATCEKDSGCHRCRKVLEKALGHDWIPATRTEPETCSRCKKTRGEPLDLLKLYPEGTPRHNGTTFTFSEADYLDLFDEFVNRGSLLSFIGTMPILKLDANGYLIPNLGHHIIGAQGQCIRTETDNATGKVSRIYIELSEEAEYTQESIEKYVLNMAMAYAVANGCVTLTEVLDHWDDTVTDNGYGTQTYKGSMNGVAYYIEVRYHYLAMEIWVEAGS